jgi:hypothetical protein
MAEASTVDETLPPEEGGPATEPKSSKGWLDMLATAKKAFERYHTVCDTVEKLYGDLERLASISREREFQLFWANIAVLGPSIYSRPPIPVVIPRFKDRKPLLRIAAELLERTAIVAIERQDIDGVMLETRDDLTVTARGVQWVILTDEGCQIDHVARRDFLHDAARKWKEVDWVAKCSWLSRKEARKRFLPTSGTEYMNAQYSKRKKDEPGYVEGDTRSKAPFWELWSKSAKRVVWISEGVTKTLDEDKPHLDLEGFFPCPKPAYSTRQRGTLIPVPDMLYYKDQLEEINEITGRIGALTESLRLRGFYPGGSGEVADAIEAALKQTNNNQVLIPINNWAMVGGAMPKDIILWVPLDQVATVIQQLIELRKQLIDDVYQITGLSDIMRGSTVASETLGAQELKSQYGSVRIRDRQNELVRIARDTIRIACEIIAENYSPDEMLKMSQMDIPRNADIAKQMADLQMQKAQIQQMVSSPQAMAAAQQDPEKAQEVMGQVQEQMQGIDSQLEELGQSVTIEQIATFLKDNKMRSFTLDIETDSTIQPDENAAKERATEFVTAVGGFINQTVPQVAMFPQLGPLASEFLKYISKQFRGGREMEGKIEEFADQMVEMSKQPRPDPAQQEAEAKAKETEMKMQADQEAKQLDAQTEQAKFAAQGESEKVAAMEKAHQAELDAQKAAQDAQIKAQADELDKQRKHAADMRQKDIDAETEKFRIIKEYEFKAMMCEKEMALKERVADHDMGLKEETAAADIDRKATESEAKVSGAKPGKASGTPKGFAGLGTAIASAIIESQNNTAKLIAASNEQVVKAITAPQQVTSPEGRTFTSKRIMN